MLYNAATSKEIINGTEYFTSNLLTGSLSRKLFEFKFYTFLKFFGEAQKKCVCPCCSDLRKKMLHSENYYITMKSQANLMSFSVEYKKIMTQGGVKECQCKSYSQAA